jgi:hypothetical protein
MYTRLMLARRSCRNCCSRVYLHCRLLSLVGAAATWPRTSPIDDGGWQLLCLDYSTILAQFPAQKLWRHTSPFIDAGAIEVSCLACVIDPRRGAAHHFRRALQAGRARLHLAAAAVQQGQVAKGLAEGVYTLVTVLLCRGASQTWSMCHNSRLVPYRNRQQVLPSIAGHGSAASTARAVRPASKHHHLLGASVVQRS